MKNDVKEHTLSKKPFSGMAPEQTIESKTPAHKIKFPDHQHDLIHDP